jgi:FADH2 O2-dependent halogenase
LTFSMTTDYDLTIIGSGFGGSLLAMIARRLGLTVLLLEKGTHPRFAIGESTSPLANLLLEQLAIRYDLPRLLPLTSYGPRQRTYPHIGCGLKRGFTYFHHTAGQPYQKATDRSNQLAVAASPHDELADTHWLRADVDSFLVGEALDAGAEYWDQVSLRVPIRTEDGGATLTGERHGQSFTVQTRLMVDATGPHGFLSKALSLPETSFSAYPATQSLFSHFTGVRRSDTLPEFGHPDTPPYPLDDAALHHVFDGGWMWVLRFGNGVTSAGIAVTDTLAQELNLSEGEPAWPRFLARFPSVGAQFAEAKPTRPFTYAPKIAYRALAASGPGWAMLPSAAAFVDPLFSTGIPLTLLGLERLGRILEEAWGTAALETRLEEYSRITLEEADATANFIGACYAAMPRFSDFAALSMFYFAAASYSEMARRLDKRHLVSRFLAADHTDFGGNLRCIADRVRRGATDIDVTEAIACLNVAGLSDAAKQNWYGVDLADVVNSAPKLGMTAAQMRVVLRTAPWAQPNNS